MKSTGTIPVLIVSAAWAALILNTCSTKALHHNSFENSISDIELLGGLIARQTEAQEDHLGESHIQTPVDLEAVAQKLTTLLLAAKDIQEVLQSASQQHAQLLREVSNLQRRLRQLSGDGVDGNTNGHEGCYPACAARTSFCVVNPVHKVEINDC